MFLLQAKIAFFLKQSFLTDFESLLQNNRDIRNHHKNIQSLMIEIFRIKNELAPPIMDSMFERRNEPYNLRNFKEFLTEKKNYALWSLDT